MSAAEELVLQVQEPVGGREDLDHYPTPAWCVEALYSHGIGMGWWRDSFFAAPPAVLDPSCGEGNVLDVFRKMGGKTYGYELHPGRAEVARGRGHQVGIGNALTRLWAPVPLVVMNPPYGTEAAKFVSHGLDWMLSREPGTARLCALLYLSFLEQSGDRREIFHTTPPDVFVLNRRPKFDGRGTNSQASAWYCWPGTGQLTWQRPR